MFVLCLWCVCVVFVLCCVVFVLRLVLSSCCVAVVRVASCVRAIVCDVLVL